MTSGSGHARSAARLATLLMTGALALWTIPNAFRGLGESRRPNDVLVWGVAVGPEDRGILAVIKEFEKRRPGTRLRVLSMGAGHMNPQKLLTAIVGGSPPDVVLQGRFNIADWASRGAFRPLNDLLARDADDPSCPNPAEYYKRVWQEASWNGQIYGIPTMSDNRALYWNKRVFRLNSARLRQHGLDPERPPRTWSELLSYSRALTTIDGKGQLTRAGFLPNFGNAWPVHYALQNDARLISPDGRRVQLDTPEARTALEFMRSGYEIAGGYRKARTYQLTFLGQEQDPFFTGQVAMKIDGDWTLQAISRFAPDLDFGVAPPPVPDHQLQNPNSIQSWVGGWAYVIPRGAHNPDGAWDFIKFATTREARMIEASGQRLWERARGRMHMPRLHAMPDVNEQLIAEFGQIPSRYARGWRTHIDLMHRSATRPVTVIGQALWDEHVRAYDRGITGKSDFSKSLRVAQIRAQRELDQFLNASKNPAIPGRALGWAAGAGGILLLVFIGWCASGSGLGPLMRRENRWAYLFLTPWFLGLLALTIGPVLVSLALSLTQWDVLGPVRWVGLANYREMFGFDAAHISRAFQNILFLCLIGVPLNVMTGLALALLLNAQTRGIGFFRTVFYLPSVVPVIAAAVLWAWILNPDPARGMVNRIWSVTLQPWFQAAPPGWLAAEEWSRPALILMGLWGAGGGILLWLAGLKGIPRDLYEAAALDGASASQSFFKVTLPMLSPILFFSLVVGFISGFQEFDRVYALVPPDQRFGAGDSLLVPMVYLFEHGFARFRMGYASAIAWLIFLFLAAITWLEFRLAERRVYYEVRQ